MSKKTWILIASLVLSLAVGLGGSLAYLTDRDADANVFTMGNVDIDLTEVFVGGSKLIPGVDITKEVKVENIGNNAAWVWVEIAIPSLLDDDDASKNVVHFNYAKESVVEGQWEWMKENAWNVERNVEHDGIEYNIYTVLYESVLNPGEITETSAMTKVYMDKKVDIDPKGDLYLVKAGVATPIGWNIKDQGQPVMHVSAYAIQENGFASVQDAWAAYTAQWTTAEGVNNGRIWAEVTKGEDNATGVRPFGVEVTSEGGTFENLNVVDNTSEEVNLRALYNQYNEDAANKITKDVVVVRSYLDGTYAMNLVADETAEATLGCYNTTFAGWTSYAGFKTAEFNSCQFQANSNPEIYNNIRPQDSTAFINCDFAGTTLMLDLLSAGDYITFEACTYKGVAMTQEMLNEMIVEAAPAGVVVEIK